MVEELKGNVCRDGDMRLRFGELSSKGRVDRVVLPRRDASKSRLRVTSDGGRDVMIDLPRGTVIRHGDVLQLDESGMLIAEWLPEETLIMKFESPHDWRQTAEAALKIGYLLGIKHFPLFVSEDEVLIPIEGSREDLRKALAAFPGIEIKVEKRILDLQQELGDHEHVH